MRKKTERNLQKLFVYAVLATVLSISCTRTGFEGTIVAVEVPAGTEISLDEARLIVINPEKPGKETNLLSDDFAAACSPYVSHDGQYLLFSGKQAKDDPWQIWQMDLRKKSTKKLVDLAEDCHDPVFLPDGKIIFSRSSSLKERNISTLFRCNTDGSELEQITFHPHIDLTSSVSYDGRILYTSSQQYPESKDPVFIVMRPDGTKSELFYRAKMGSYPVSRGIESEDGYVYFVEHNQKKNNSGIMVLNQNRPLYSGIHLSEDIEGDFSSIIPLEYNKCLVSFRPTEEENFALHEFDTKNRQFSNLLYKSENNVIDMVLIENKERPRKLPSAVDFNNSTGLLMSQNINHSMIPSAGNGEKADRIQVFGLDSLISEVEVMEDGSFYLKMDADIPYRFQTINSEGLPVRGPSAWIWLRPNERRGCVGCHADNELAPENRVPMAVKGPPVVITVKGQNSN